MVDGCLGEMGSGGKGRTYSAGAFIALRGTGKKGRHAPPVGIHSGWYCGEDGDSWFKGRGLERLLAKKE